MTFKYRRIVKAVKAMRSLEFECGCALNIQNVDIDGEGALEQRGHALLNQCPELTCKQRLRNRKIDVGRKKRRDGAIWKKGRCVDADCGGIG